MFWRMERRAILKGLLGIISLLLFAVITLMLFAPQGYHYEQGTMVYRLGMPQGFKGDVVFDLGPGGSISFHVTKMPININSGYVLDDNNPLSVGRFIDLYPTVQAGVKATIGKFFISRIPYIILLGILAGVTRTNGAAKGWLRRAARNGFFGFAYASVIALVIAGVTYVTYDAHGLKEPEYAGVAKNIPKIGKIAKKSSNDKAVKNAGLENWVRGLATVSFQTQRLESYKPEDHVLFFCASDIHDNPASADIIRQFVQTQSFGKISAVFIVGDTATLGSRTELQDISYLAATVKASDALPVDQVGGNHDDLNAMMAFDVGGYLNLHGNEVTQAGITIFGDNDPSAFNADIAPLEEDKVLAESSEMLLHEWNLLTKKPQILLIHNLKQAADVIAQAKEEKYPLTVVYGHDHKYGFEQDGSVNLVDVGTSGGSGLDNPEIRNAPYSFQILDFSIAEGSPKLFNVITIVFEGLGPDAIAHVQHHRLD